MKKTTDYGTVEYKGKTLTIAQQPYADDFTDYYIALAIDEDENDYMVSWPITCEDFDNLEDESDACDWEDYKVKKLGVEA